MTDTPYLPSAAVLETMASAASKERYVSVCVFEMKAALKAAYEQHGLMLGVVTVEEEKFNIIATQVYDDEIRYGGRTIYYGPTKGMAQKTITEIVEDYKLRHSLLEPSSCRKSSPQGEAPPREGMRSAQHNAIKHLFDNVSVVHDRRQDLAPDAQTLRITAPGIKDFYMDNAVTEFTLPNIIRRVLMWMECELMMRREAFFSSQSAQTAYETACDLAEKNHARVIFEFDGQTFTVGPTRLARKIKDQSAQVDALREALGHALRLMSRDQQATMTSPTYEEALSLLPAPAPVKDGS